MKIKVKIENAPTLSVGDSRTSQVEDQLVVIGYPGVADAKGLIASTTLVELVKAERIEPKPSDTTRSWNADQGTTNGTSINDITRGRIACAELRDGDVVIVGEPDCSSLQVRLG